MTAPAIPPEFPFSPGDRLRVTVDEPYGTELHAGDLVTVEEVGMKTDGSGVEIPVVFVATSYGIRILGLDAVEAAALPAYVPAEPDEIVDARLKAIIEADEDLSTFFRDADTALGADEAKVSDQLAGHSGPAWSDPGPDDLFRFTDYAGDEITFYYAEKQCDAHGREAAFFVVVNEMDEDTVMIPATQIDPLIRFLFTRRKHSERPETD